MRKLFVFVLLCWSLIHAEAQTIRLSFNDVSLSEALRTLNNATSRYEVNFIYNELEAGKKTSSLNTRIRGLRVFFSFCAEREYMKPIRPKLMKVDRLRQRRRFSLPPCPPQSPLP